MGPGDAAAAGQPPPRTSLAALGMPGPAHGAGGAAAHRRPAPAAAAPAATSIFGAAGPAPAARGALGGGGGGLGFGGGFLNNSGSQQPSWAPAIATRENQPQGAAAAATGSSGHIHIEVDAEFQRGGALDLPPPALLLPGYSTMPQVRQAGSRGDPPYGPWPRPTGVATRWNPCQLRRSCMCRMQPGRTRSVPLQAPAASVQSHNCNLSICFGVRLPVGLPVCVCACAAAAVRVPVAGRPRPRATGAQALCSHAKGEPGQAGPVGERGPRLLPGRSPGGARQRRRRPAGGAPAPGDLHGRGVPGWRRHRRQRRGAGCRAGGAAACP